jgi:hypothetical protein
LQSFSTDITELLGLQTGDVTRWLHLATYFYSQNQFSFSLEIVDHVLAQCTPDKLYYDEDKFIHEHVQGIVYEEKVLNWLPVYALYLNTHP